MGVIAKIPEPMDWRLENIAGNNAAALVNQEFDLLKDMIDDALKASDEALSRIGSNIPDFGSIYFDSSFDPFDVAAVLEKFDGTVSLDSFDLSMPAEQAIVEPVDPGAAPDIDFTPEDFNGDLKFDDSITPPDGSFNYVEPEYVSRLTDPIIDKVLATLSGGGQAYGEVVEAAIWSRAKDRIADEYEETYDKTARKWANSGWDMPSGFEAAALREVDNKRNRALEQLNYEEMIEQARIALQDYHKAFDTGLTMEQILRDFFNAVWNRALQAASESVRMALAVYSSLVEYNRLYLEKYKTQADVYQIKTATTVQAQLARVEIFKAKVEVFIAQWQGQKTKMDAYLAAVSGQKVKADAVTAVNANRLQEFEVKQQAHDNHQKNILGLEEVKSRVQAANAEHEATLGRISIAAQDGNIKNAIERINILQRQYEVVSQILTQRLASLLSAFNISASIGDSESTQESLAHSYSHQDSVSANVSENYSY